MSVLITTGLCVHSFAIASDVTTDTAAELTFSEAWQLLQQNNNGLAASRANKEESVFMQEAARDLYYPKIDINGGYSRLDRTLPWHHHSYSIPCQQAVFYRIFSTALADWVV